MKPILSLAAVVLTASAARAAAPVDFARDVQPILATACANCHGPAKAKGGIRVDTLDALTKSGVVVAGNSAKSTLFLCLNGDGGLAKMPPKGQLTNQQMATIKDWIDQGAKAAAGAVAAAGAAPANKPVANAKPVAPAKPQVLGNGRPQPQRGKETLEKERERQKEAMEKLRELQKKARERDKD